jgi:hypothetical protein
MFAPCALDRSSSGQTSGAGVTIINGLALHAHMTAKISWALSVSCVAWRLGVVSDALTRLLDA